MITANQEKKETRRSVEQQLQLSYKQQPEKLLLEKPYSRKWPAYKARKYTVESTVAILVVAYGIQKGVQ